MGGGRCGGMVELLVLHRWSGENSRKLSWTGLFLGVCEQQELRNLKI